MAHEASVRRIYRFDRFTLDLVRGALLDRDGAEVPLRPKAFALLRHLVENAGRLIDRDEILAAVWPGVFVTEDSITLCIREIRRALGGDQAQLLRTVPRRGYLLEAGVTRLDGAAGPGGAPGPGAPAEAPATAGEARPAERPVLVVLPFDNMTGDAGQEYFADGMTEDLTTALSHLRWFSVISRNSAFTYKGRAVDVRQVGRELGAGYVLEGSIRRAGDRVRVNAQLCAADDGRHVWAQRFDAGLQDIFALQDHVVEAVSAAIEPNLQMAEAERARARPTGSLGAYDLYLRALPQRWRGTRDSTDEALALLRRAVALDGDFAAAWGMLADLAGYRISQGWAAPCEAEEALRGARQLADAAVVDNPSALAWAGYALSFVGRDFAAGLGTAQRALALAPHSSQVLFLSGWCHLYAGAWRPAVAHLEHAMRLSPVDPLILTFHVALGAAHFTGERYAAAADHARTACGTRQGYLVPLRLLAASLALLGQVEEARAAVADLRRAAPEETLRTIAARTALSGEVRDRFLGGLRLAGLPE